MNLERPDGSIIYCKLVKKTTKNTWYIKRLQQDCVQLFKINMHVFKNDLATLKYQYYQNVQIYASQLV